MINLLMVRNELGETRVCILVNGDQEETWSFEPRKWVGEGIVDCKIEGDAFCWVIILI